MNNENRVDLAEQQSAGQETQHGYFAWFLPVRSVLFVLIFLIGAALVRKDLSELTHWWSIVASAGNVLTILLLLMLVKKEHTTYRALIGYRKGALSAKKTAGLIIGFVMIGMTGMYLAGLVCYGSIMPRITLQIIAPVSPVLAIINAVILPATVAFAEDGLYLGCGVNQIRNRVAAVAVPAFFYALQHCFIPTLFDARYMLYRFLSFLPLTVVFCLYFQKRKNPLPIMVSHAILDFATGAMIVMTSVSPALYDKMCSL